MTPSNYSAALRNSRLVPSGIAKSCADSPRRLALREFAHARRPCRILPDETELQAS